jgi:alanyl-tRNA synthetase
MREILAAAENASDVRYGTTPLSDISLRKLADHGRAVTFLMSDNVVPSNQGRRHVVRRLVRGATRQAFRVGVQDLIMPTLIGATVNVMKDGYPELAEVRKRSG